MGLIGVAPGHFRRLSCGFGDGVDHSVHHGVARAGEKQRPIVLPSLARFVLPSLAQ